MRTCAPIARSLWGMLVLATMLRAQAVPAPEPVRIEHFVQVGTGHDAALAPRGPGAVRICGGGIAAVFGPRVPSRAVLQQWLQSTDVVAAAARDLPFWASVDAAGVDLVATNVRDRDGQPLGVPFRIETSGKVRIAILAVITGTAPPGFTLLDAAATLQQVLPTAQQEADMALVVVDGDVAAARALLAVCPSVSLTLVTADRRSVRQVLPAGRQLLVQSPRGGAALGVLTMPWNGKELGAPEHRFVPTFLDAWGQQQAAQLDAALRPVVPAEDDAGVAVRGLADFGIAPAAVDTAIARATAALARELRSDHEQRFLLGYATDHLLIALALVHAGEHRRDATFDRALRTMLQQLELPNLGVYAAGLFCMLVEAYGQPEFHARLRGAARYLVEGQAADGSWTYTPKVDPALCADPDRRVLQVTGGPLPTVDASVWQRSTPWSLHPSGDNSLTQFAVLGLRAAQRCSVPVPAATWQRAEGWFRRGQQQDGGFGYTQGTNAATGSMTLAGIGGLAITTHELGNVDFARDEAVRRGLGWLRAHFAIDDNPRGSGHFYYYLYSLERTGRIFDREVLCGQEWYPLGVQQLLKTQSPDGLWQTPGAESPRIATSFALLFLCRATPRLHEERRHGGNGTLQTFARAAPGARIYVILDASGSMLETVGTTTRFTLARAAVEHVLDAMPPGPQVALRVYGHRKRAIESGADEDTELLVPLGPLDRAALFGKLAALRARGKTPLARSLQAAATDLGPHGGAATTVVLLTDGGEDSMPRQDPTSAAAALGRIPGLRLHVVGFDIDRADWQAQLRAMAAAGHGDYLAADRTGLAEHLRAAVLQAPESFTIADAAGNELQQGRFGASLTLPEGTYRLTATYRGQPFATEFGIGTDTVTSVVFDGALATVVQQGPPGAAQCRACRHPIAAEAKFCPDCGARQAASR